MKTSRRCPAHARFSVSSRSPCSSRRRSRDRSGKYVPIRETVRGFKEILDGMYDELPEQAFYMIGGIEEAVERAREMAAEG